MKAFDAAFAVLIAILVALVGFDMGLRYVLIFTGGFTLMVLFLCALTATFKGLGLK